ncbi:MAG TPA: HD domain-containing phosphohydrolase [Acidobacteriaceae bacterium]|nr:HD domain-containing phosphohydrolase [Acidobacteriaceae bacterium]
MPLRSKIQIALTICVAFAATGLAAHAGSGPWFPFWILLAAVLLTSPLKVALPRGDGSMSLNFPFILLGIVQLSPLQAMLLAALSVAAQCRIRVRKIFTAVQICFNVANAMLATGCAFYTYAGLHHESVALAPALAAAAVAYFLWNTFAVAMVIASTMGENTIALWRKEYPWYLPFYVVGAVLAAMASWLGTRFGWGTALLLIPVVYTLYRSYMGQVSRLRERQQHLEETEALHLRTIEGLAMAIEAKDQNTHDHLFRVRQYVKAVGEALDLDKLEMQALETAAFLHDIGKLAVPEHIINKPGKLTPEEFEKMKIHPVVGADILERVRFPYPVVPIVRSHHEWWNGTGYPDGLRGTDIPIGARILTVVDCFDALVSDRPYRTGMSSEKALNLIRSLAGKQFDPAVVDAFERCHQIAESLAESVIPPGFTPLNTEVEVWRGLAPGAGYEAGSEETLSNLPAAPASSANARTLEPQSGVESLNLIAAASQEAQTLFEMSQSLGNSLSPNETVSVMASRLRRLIPFQVCALYMKHGDALEARFLDGEQAKAFAPKEIQLGEGISGWVAQSGKPILNGNAAVEPGCPLTSSGAPALRSALSIPLFDLQKEIFAVLTLYATASDSFLRDHLRILQAMESKLSLSMQNALQYRRTETDAETDFLTGLPNARRLFLQLEAELDTCRDTGQPLAVLVCDLNDFKDVNDRRGHLAGNRLLRLVADGFRQLCAGGEIVARMGGDEFVFLLPGVPQEIARERLDAITGVVIAASRRAGHSLRVTASVGVAVCPADGNIAEDLLAAADRRMYLDKQRHYSESTSVSMETKPSAAIVYSGS